MDFATTMDALSWEFYNRFVTVLIDYGIVYLPLLIFLYQHWLSKKMLGTDAMQNVVTIMVKRMLISVTTFFFLYYLAFLPTVPLSTVNNFRATDPIPAYDSTFNQNVIKAGNQLLSHDIVVKVPLFWAAMQIFVHGITQRFLEAMPTTAGDIRGAMATVLKNKSIKTPFVKDQYNHFYNECFLPAAGKFKFMKDRGDITTGSWFGNDAQISDYDWVGGKYYLETEGFYKPCQIRSNNECSKAPVTPAGFYASIYDDVAVSCEDLWLTNGGLKKNLIKEFKLESDNSDFWINNQLRHRLKNNSGIGIQKDQAVKNLEQGNWFSLNSMTTIIKQALALMGAWVTEFLLEITTTAIIAFLPIGQALALAFFVIILPIAMILSALRVDIFIGFLMYYFGISFLTVIWAVIGFIDNNMMNILAGQEGQGVGSGVVETAAQIVSHTTLTGSLISIATTFLYYQATKKWFTIMAMLGGAGMKEADQAMNEIGSSGSEVSSTVGKKIGK